MRINLVAIVGEANSGKSTLINNILGEKISIVSPKAQTTRNNIHGIKSINDTQIVFVDTPGFCKTKSNINRILHKNAKSAYIDSDTILVIIDALSRNNTNIFNFLDSIKAFEHCNIIAAINKVDCATKESILGIASNLKDRNFVKHTFMISAKRGDGINDLEKCLVSMSRDGTWYYDEKQITNLPISFRLAEITREKVFLLLHQELPYNIYVETEVIQEFKSKVIIHQAIVASKPNHKMIIIGSGSSMIKEIKRLAAPDMKKLFGGKNITLKLFVKIEKNWDTKKEHLRNSYLA